MESSSPPSSTTSMGAARDQEEPAPTPAPSNRGSSGRQGGGGERGGGGGKGPTGGGSTKKKKKKVVALPRMGAGGGEEEEEDQPSIRVHEDIRHFKPPISPEVRVHVPGCRCMETFRHRLAAGKRPGYVVVPAKGHKDTCFFFPSPHHSLDTEKDLSSVLSGRGLSIKLTTCSRMMLGPRVAPAITYLHGAAVILGDGPVLQRLADQYEQHRLKRKEAVAKQEQEGGEVVAMADDEAAMFVVVPLPRGVQTRSYLQGLEKQLQAHHKIVSSGVSKVVAEHHLRSSLAGLDHELVRRHLLPLLLQQGGALLEEPALLAMVQSWPDAHNLDILGGKRDLGETSMQATHREAWEESGGLIDLSDSGAFVRVPGLDQRDQAMAFFAYLYLPPEQRKPPAAGGPPASSTTEGQQQQQAGPTFASPSRAHTAPPPSPQEAGGQQQQGEAGLTPAPQPQHPPPPPPSRSQQLQQLRPTARPFTYRPATGPSPAAPPPPPPYHNQRHQQPWEQQPQQHGGWEGGRPWPTESSSSSRPGGLTSGRRMRPQHGQGGGGGGKGAGGQDEEDGGEAVVRAEGPPVRHQQHHGRRGRGAGGQPWHWG